jgi:hypothetical protein
MLFCSVDSLPPVLRFISTHSRHSGINKSGMPLTTPSAFKRLAPVIDRFSPFGIAKIRTVGYWTRNQLTNPTCSECSEGDVFKTEISVTAEAVRFAFHFSSPIGYNQAARSLGTVGHVLDGFTFTRLGVTQKLALIQAPRLCCEHGRCPKSPTCEPVYRLCSVPPVIWA